MYEVSPQVPSILVWEFKEDPDSPLRSGARVKILSNTALFAGLRLRSMKGATMWSHGRVQRCDLAWCGVQGCVGGTIAGSALNSLQRATIATSI
ncbi:hypothetical protein LguiB_032741 [Lonicera macranthoides]